MSGDTQPQPAANLDWAHQAQTLLFVPGTRADRFERARDSGADAVIIDLEDAVEPGAKDRARSHAVSWLDAGERGIVRINPAGSPWFDADLDALGSLGPLVVLVPKVEEQHDITTVAAALSPGSAVIACVETALGLHRVCEIAGTSIAVSRLALGNMDLARDLGVSPDGGPLLDHAAASLVMESRAHGLPPPIAGVTADLRDTVAVARDTAHAVSLGFGGKVCIHPAQVQPVVDGFAPTPSMITWAQQVLTASAAGGVTVVDGQMVDKPVTDRASAILRRAGVGDVSSI